ncbi:hypothetical protein Q0812_10865 [Brevundimonas sp. 2R-24]|uniref:DUF4178 domain-containing protein n=1 Tax=Peiella sedimenti TaxID=3061083 RepID=A0ABT8SP79_9CAUL|nr:hypothetical protein [Caulobacteraceae bacterium XZ-24]
MVSWWWAIPIVTGLIGVWVLLAGLGRLFRGRGLSGLLGVVGGGGFLAAAAVVALTGMNVQTYHRLTYERPVATIQVEQRGPRLYTVTLTEPATRAYPEGYSRDYEVQGDEWRLEARVLKWKPWANVLGLDSQYRLDRLSGRYEDVESERSAPRSVHDLGGAPGRIDVWKLSREGGRMSRAVDALYGGGVFMPMADGARYEVWITQSGLVARPANPIAEQAGGEGWR